MVYDTKSVWTKGNNITPVYSAESILARWDQILRQETAQNWPYLPQIAEELMPYDWYSGWS